MNWEQKNGVRDKVNELKLLNDTLQKENYTKDREIRKLSNDIQQCEHTIAALKKEITLSRTNPTRDVEVMTEVSSPIAQCEDIVPEQDYSGGWPAQTPRGPPHAPHPSTQSPPHAPHAPLAHLDLSHKFSEGSVRAVRKQNVELKEEVRAVSQLCGALYEQRHDAQLRLQFKDDIIREMRRQLRQAKAKLEQSKCMKAAEKPLSAEREDGSGAAGAGGGGCSGGGSGVCVRRQPRRSRHDIEWECHSHDASPDDTDSIKEEVGERQVCRSRCGALPATSTPNTSRDADHALVEPPSNETIPILDDSSSAERTKVECKKKCRPKCQRKDSLETIRKVYKREADKPECMRKLPTSISFDGCDRSKRNVCNSASKSSLSLEIQSSGTQTPGRCPPQRSLHPWSKTPTHFDYTKTKNCGRARGRPGTVKKQPSKRCCKMCHSSNSLVKEMAKLRVYNDTQDEIEYKRQPCGLNDCDKSQSSSINSKILQLSPEPLAIISRRRGKCGAKCRKQDSLIVIEPAARCVCSPDKHKLKEKQNYSFDECLKRAKSQEDVSDQKPSKTKLGCKCSKKKKTDEKRIPKYALAGDEKELFTDLIGSESIGTSSGPGSGVSDATGAGEQCAIKCLRNKLLATMRILENKEETIRVQAQSLTVAQQRIAALTERADYYRRQLDQCQHTPRCQMPRKAQVSDVCINTDVNKEELCQKKIVSTLQDNLSVIEELYRECFYETAKQEELIDLLRKSCADVKCMERQKTEQIGQLQHVVHTQKWSLEKCQDIATEVETLKTEISNFLNSSNQDSGMWEAQGAQGVQGVRGEELAADVQQVAAQLLRLRDLLASECICGLKEENAKLRQRNEHLEVTNKDVRKRVQELEKALQDKDDENEKCQQKGKLMCEQVCMLQKKYKEQVAASESLTAQLQHCKELLASKCCEVTQLQREVAERNCAAAELRDQLSKAQLAAQQEAEVREEVRVLSRAVCGWRAQLSTCQQRMRRLETELQQARDQCENLAAHYREKEGSVVQLQQELEEAHGRGAALCKETRALVAGLRCWLRRHRERIREQENKINEQEELICALRQSTPRDCASKERACCSRTLLPAAQGAARADGGAASGSEKSGCNKCKLLRKKSSVRSCEVKHHSKHCRAEGEKSAERDRTSGSETTNRSFPPKHSPKNLKKERPPSAGECAWSRREVGVQRPVRCDATTEGSCVRRPSPRTHSPLCACWPPLPPPTHPCEESAAEQLLERMEGARHALHAAHERWHSRTDTGAQPRRDT